MQLLLIGFLYFGHLSIEIDQIDQNQSQSQEIVRWINLYRQQSNGIVDMLPPDNRH